MGPTDFGGKQSRHESCDCMQVEVLARAHALLLQSGLLSWTQLELYAMKPFHPQTFWKHANSLYRHFTVFFLAHALQVTSYFSVHTAPCAQEPHTVGQLNTSANLEWSQSHCMCLQFVCSPCQQTIVLGATASVMSAVLLSA